MALSKEVLNTSPILRRAAISFSARGHFQRVGAAFELAGAGDQRERQVRAEANGARAAADLDDGVIAHGDPSFLNPHAN